jgi:ATP-dependent DNA ligase
MAPFDLPPPLALAAPVDELPDTPGLTYEAKLDGWRCSCHTTGGRLWSRRGTDLSVAFADIAAAARRLPEAVLDGELIALNAAGEIVFSKLQSRSRGPRAGEPFTVQYVAFDLLALGDTDWRGRRYSERRRELERLLADGPPAIRPVPATTDREQALTWVGGLGGGIEGLVGKPDSPYRAGVKSGWIKWRQRHTTEAVIVGVTRTAPAHQALVIAQPVRGRLRTVGVTLPIGDRLRGEIAPLLRPAGPARELPGTVGGLPGADPIPYVPVHPDLVLEIEADQAAPTEFGRFRHRPRAVRLRPDLRPGDL